MDADRRKASARRPEGAARLSSPKSASPRAWHLYVVECADGSLYVGISKDVEKRVAAHNSGRGARYTSTRRPVRLVYSEVCRDVGEALRREREVKRWSRPKKIESFGLTGPPKLGKPRPRPRASAGSIGAALRRCA